MKFEKANLKSVIQSRNLRAFLSAKLVLRTDLIVEQRLEVGLPLLSGRPRQKLLQERKVDGGTTEPRELVVLQMLVDLFVRLLERLCLVVGALDGLLQLLKEMAVKKTCKGYANLCGIYVKVYVCQCSSNHPR